MKAIVSKFVPLVGAVALATTLPAQSATIVGPSTVTTVEAAQDPSPAPKRPSATTRLKEVIELLASGDLSEEQRADAEAKLRAIAEQLAQQEGRGQRPGGARGLGGARGEGPSTGQPGMRYKVRSPEPPRAQGTRVMTVEGGEPGSIAVVEVVPEVAPAPPTPSAPRRLRSLMAPAAPAAPEAFDAPTPAEGPRAASPRTRAFVVGPDSRTRELDLAKMEVDRANLEQARIELERKAVTLRETAAAEHLSRAAEDAHRRAAEGRAIAERLMHDDGEAIVVRKRAAKASEQAEDDDVRAMIEEMRAEMREIRSLIRELRKRSAEAGEGRTGAAAPAAPGDSFSASAGVAPSHHMLGGVKSTTTDTTTLNHLLGGAGSSFTPTLNKQLGGVRSTSAAR